MKVERMTLSAPDLVEAISNFIEQNDSSGCFLSGQIKKVTLIKSGEIGKLGYEDPDVAVIEWE